VRPQAAPTALSPVELAASGAALGAGLFLLNQLGDAGGSSGSGRAAGDTASVAAASAEPASAAAAPPARSKSSAGVRGVGTAESVGGRTEMEDTLDLRLEGRCGYLYAGVFDGHGGAASSEFLKLALYDAFSKAVDADERDAVSPVLPQNADGSLACPMALKAPLEDAFKATDRELISYLSTLGEPECWSGSTATAALVRSDRITVANVGDSRAVLCRAARAMSLTTEHRPVESYRDGKREAERVREAGGWVDQGRVCGILAVSRAFGDIDFKDERAFLLEELREGGARNAKDATFEHPLVVPLPDVTEVARSPEDQFLLIATDGLWDCVSNEQACSRVRKELDKHGDVQKAADALVYTAVHSWRTQDNIAVCIIDLRPEAK